FFCSGRRRHTRFSRDWSSDVCSSDLGRTAADDVGFEAAFLARELGRPVRVQWMRHEETAWDTKGPAYAFKLRGGLDAQGRITAKIGRAARRARVQATRHDARAIDRYN